MNEREKEIQEVIGTHNFSKKHSPITFNFQGEGLGECDVISISKSGYVYEYEIKVSRSDFKADFKKTWKHEKLINLEPLRILDEWMNGKKTGGKVTQVIIPNYFYYVTPPGMLKVDEIPPYAGLGEETGESWIRIIKKAPKLHKHKATDRLIKSIAHNLTCKLLFGCSFMTYQNKQRKLENANRN